MLQTINITALQGAAKPFKDTVTVPLSAPADSVFYGFGTALNWNDGTKSVMQGGNGTLVLMKDTVPPVNNLVISGKYLGVDTAAVYLDNISLHRHGKGGFGRGMVRAQGQREFFGLVYEMVPGKRPDKRGNRQSLYVQDTRPAV